MERGLRERSGTRSNKTKPEVNFLRVGSSDDESKNKTAKGLEEKGSKEVKAAC